MAGTGRNVGATREELLRAVARPGVDINAFDHALLTLQKYGANFHENAGLFYFDLEENADAKVEFHALQQKYADSAPSELLTLWLTEVFKEPTAVAYRDEGQAKDALEALERALRLEHGVE